MATQNFVNIGSSIGITWIFVDLPSMMSCIIQLSEGNFIGIAQVINH